MGENGGGRTIPIVSIEDGLARRMTGDGWALLTKQVWRPKIQLVGDDLFVTNVRALAARQLTRGVGRTRS